MNQKIFIKIILITVIIIILLSVVGYFTLTKKSRQTYTKPVNLQEFLSPEYQLVFQKELDLDGDNRNEIAILTFNPNAPDDPDCKGYCDPSYMIKIIKFTTSNQWELLYENSQTRRELSWDKFEVVDYDRDGKQELLFSYQFVRTHPSFLLKWVNDKIETVGIVDEITEANKTAGWKIYRYDQYGFQISYPPDWTPYISTTFEEGTLGFNSPKDTQGNFMSFSIQRYNLENSGFGYPPEILTAPNTMVDKVKAYKDEGYVRNPDGPSIQSISLIKDNFVYSLTFQVFKKYSLPSKYKYEDIKPARFTPEEEKLREAFISTFKFIK